MDHNKLSKDDLNGSNKIIIRFLIIGTQNKLDIILFGKDKMESGAFKLLVHVSRFLLKKKYGINKY